MKEYKQLLNRVLCSIIVLFIALITCLAAGGITKVTGCTEEDIFLQTLLPAQADIDESAPEESEDKVVYLTFDDGPSKTTKTVLDVLYREHVPATFFVIADENNQKHLPLLTRTVEEGHLIALHSCTHNYRKIYSSPDAFWQDIENLKAALLPYDCGESMILRFPGGSTNTVSKKYGGHTIMKELKAQAIGKGYRYIDWNVCAEDAVGGHPSAETIYNNVIRQASKQNTCVVLMHDTAATKNTAAALPDIIAWFKAAGYRFDTVDNLDKQI